MPQAKTKKNQKSLVLHDILDHGQGVYGRCRNIATLFDAGYLTARGARWAMLWTPQEEHDFLPFMTLAALADLDRDAAA